MLGPNFAKTPTLAWRGPEDSKTQGNPAFLSLGSFDAAPGQSMDKLKF